MCENQTPKDFFPFRATIITLYPELFPGPLNYSLSGKALEKGIWTCDTIYIRNFAQDKHRTVDDTPYGGGNGMVMRADVVAKAIDAAPLEYPRIFLTPRGRPYSQKDAKKISQSGGVTLLCGHFEGVDARVIEKRELEEISIGDYVLSGGEIAVYPFLDSIIRLLPNVLGNSCSAEEESFEDYLLEYNAYTKPRVFEDAKVPEILFSGNHAKIISYRQEEREAITKKRRPDLYDRYLKNKN